MMSNSIWTTYVRVNGKDILVKPDIYIPSGKVNRVRRPNSERYVAADKECNRLSSRIQELERIIFEYCDPTHASKDDEVIIETIQAEWMRRDMANG